MVSSEVVNTFPGGSAVEIAAPRGASARYAMVPAENAPAGVCHHADAGIANTAIPGPPSVGCRPE